MTVCVYYLCGDYTAVRNIYESEILCIQYICGVHVLCTDEKIYYLIELAE